MEDKEVVKKANEALKSIFSEPMTTEEARDTAAKFISLQLSMLKDTGLIVEGFAAQLNNYSIDVTINEIENEPKKPDLTLVQ